MVYLAKKVPQCGWDLPDHGRQLWDHKLYPANLYLVMRGLMSNDEWGSWVTDFTSHHSHTILILFPANMYRDFPTFPKFGPGVGWIATKVWKTGFFQKELGKDL